MSDNTVLSGETMPKLILIRGVPGSGKTTMAKLFEAQGYAHYEADQYFLIDGEYKYDRKLLGNAHEACQHNAIASMMMGESVVVSNTFIRKWEMQPYIDAANRMGYEVHIIKAEGRFKNIHGVPDTVVNMMADRYEEV